MLKRLMATLMAVILVVAVLAGCGAKKTTNSNVTKITMWSADSHSKLVMEKLVNEFNRTIGNENDIENINNSIYNTVCQRVGNVVYIVYNTDKDFSVGARIVI